MWSAQDPAEARPDILVMSSGKIFSVFWSDCTLPEVCPGGATHGQEEKRGVVDPGDALEEHLLLPRLVRQKLLHVLLLPKGNAQDLHPLLGGRKQRITSPNNSFKFQRSRSPGHLLDPTGFDATSIPHLGLAVVHVDVGVCGQLFVHRRVHFVQTLWSTRGVCVGCAIVQADNAPDCGVAQGVIHGVPVHHGEKQEEEEGEVEQEVEGNKEEDNNQTPVRMSMDEME